MADPAEVRAIARGPGGTMWFLESGISVPQVVRIAANATYTEFPITAYSNPQGLTQGADGNMWFTEAGKVGSIARAR